MSWAAVWIYEATGKKQYIQDILNEKDGTYTGYISKIIKTEQDKWQNFWVHCWDVKWGGVFAKLAPITKSDRDWEVFRSNIEYFHQKKRMYRRFTQKQRLMRKTMNELKLRLSCIMKLCILQGF